MKKTIIDKYRLPAHKILQNIILEQNFDLKDEKLWTYFAYCTEIDLQINRHSKHQK